MHGASLAGSIADAIPSILLTILSRVYPCLQHLTRTALRAATDVRACLCAGLHAVWCAPYGRTTADDDRRRRLGRRLGSVQHSPASLLTAFGEPLLTSAALL